MKINFVFLAVGLLLGMYLSVAYCVVTPTSISTTPRSVQESKRSVASSESVYSRSMDSLTKVSNTLKVNLTSTKAELTVAKQKAAALRTQISRLLQSKSERKDSSEVIAVSPSDSISIATESFMQVSVQKDSLYERVTANLEDQVAMKDSMLTHEVALRSSLRTALSQSEVEQAASQEQNKQLFKALNRQKTNSKILSSALFILTGAAAGYLLTH